MGTRRPLQAETRKWHARARDAGTPSTSTDTQARTRVAPIGAGAEPGGPPLAPLMQALAEAAASAESLRDYRARVLDVLRPVVPFDAALVHALSPRVPLSTAVIEGLDPAVVQRSVSLWDELGDALSPLREHANRRLVATDRMLPRGGASRRRLDRLVLRPFSQRAICVVHLVVRGEVTAVVVLCARRSDAFGLAAEATLQRLAPLIAAGDRLHQRLDAVPAVPSRVRLRCDDQRLTPRQREIVEHVALGLTNADIAAATGLSPYSVRNHLARIFPRVGAGNRADVVRRAVLLPAGRARQRFRQPSK